MSSACSVTDNSTAVKNGQPITLISYRAQEFETQELNLLDYTKCLLSRNAPNGVHLTQDEVNGLFEGDVQATYGKDHPNCQFLLQQISSPLTTDFWEKHTDPGKFLIRKTQEAKTSFRALPRDKHNQQKGSIVLSNGITKILVPDIDLVSLKSVNYLDIVRNIHQANKGEHMSAAKMDRIWEGIVINVYHFESESTKLCKLAEATSNEANSYWRMVSDYRLALRQQRVRLVAADFFGDYPRHVDREKDHTLSTTTGPRQQLLNRDIRIVDAGQVLENEQRQQPCEGKSLNPPPPQAFLNSVSSFVAGSPPHHADDGTNSVQLRPAAAAAAAGFRPPFPQDFRPCRRCRCEWHCHHQQQSRNTLFLMMMTTTTTGQANVANE